ncbi:glycosyltransferase [Cereibacter johrii]|uniref:glycosyltransferase n=1 Tax=Cereibacter johrii TaxID=445629 RepID=UPI002468130E|nr:glycosyltransferase [Cereibacter johrii]
MYRTRRREASRMIRHDQSLYNAVLRGDWAGLSPMWNWPYSRSARPFATMRYPHIVRFIGTLKPRADRKGRYSLRFAQICDRFIADHFPDRPRAPVSGGLSPESRLMRKMLMKHFLPSSKLARYLGRFPSDLTVIR